jgi:hypothetical protein
MDYSITIPDELIPGIVAIAYAEGRQPEDVVQSYAISAATKACQDLKVGPYYVGPTPPQFNQDGTPYVAPAQADETAPVEEVVTEPDPQVNDTTQPDGGDV